MYDTVVFKCPKCSSNLEEQSKFGNCTLEYFNSDEVPVSIAYSMIGKKISCYNCNKQFEIVTGQKLNVIKLGLIE